MEADGDPLYTGKPRDPANGRSKKRAWMALLITGFALAVDFTMAMMSIQAFYYSLRGPQNLFGLTFGAWFKLACPPTMRSLSTHSDSMFVYQVRMIWVR